MMSRWGLIGGVILSGIWQVPLAIAAEDAVPQACINVAKRGPDGTSSDRFLREWCQRNHGKNADSPNTPGPDAIGAPPSSESPKAAEPVSPSSESSGYSGYGNDNAADGLNSSRLPPGYHCHMLKFGERICHGGLD